MTYPKKLTPLKTKISPPHYENTLVKRQRLIAKTPQDLLFKTTLFVAPAGYGKSTLLYQYYQQVKQTISCAWLNIDENDNNPITLIQHLIFTSTLALNIEWKQEDDDNPQAKNLLQHLIHQIETNEQPLLLFIDDIHYLKQKDTLQSFKKLLHNTSPYLGFVIAGRSYPRIGLSRLKLSQKLKQYNLDALSFNPEETNALFHSFNKIKLSKDQLSSIQKQTEGWATSIQLLAMASQRHTTDELLNNLNSPTLDITHYLEEIVLQQQSPKLQEFLLKTSVLDRFTVELCEYVSGDNQANQLLETIKSKQLFLITLDVQGHWYRYHHLFQFFLQEKFKKQGKKRYQSCLLKASEWCEQHKLIVESINYALKGKLFKHASHLLAKYRDINSYIINTNTSSFNNLSLLHIHISFIDQLPKNYLIKDPLLYLEFIDNLIATYNHKHAKQHLKSFDQWLNKKTNHKKSPCVKNVKILTKLLIRRDFINCTILAYSDQFDALYKAGKNWLKKNPNIVSYERVQINLYCALACTFNGRLDQVQFFLDENAKILKSLDAAIHNQVVQNWALFLQGKVKSTDYLTRNLLKKNRNLVNVNKDTQSILMLNIAEINRQFGHINYDLKKLLDLKKVVRKVNQPACFFSCLYGTINKYLWLNGKHDKAINTIKQDRKEHTLPAKSALMNSMFTNEVIRQLISIDKLNEAQLEKKQLLEFIEKYPNNDKVAKQHIQEHLDMIDIRFYLFEKKYQPALDLLAPLIKQIASQHRNARLLQVLIMQAWAYYLANQEKQAMQSLKQAFDISIPNGIIITFIEEGYAIKPLIRKCIATIANKNPSAEITQYQETLLNVLAINPTIESKIITKEPLKNSLTPKELKILKLLNSLDGLKIVADKAGVTYLTLRWHTKNIYQKLEVYRRVDAVEKAKELEFI